MLKIAVTHIHNISESIYIVNYQTNSSFHLAYNVNISRI